MQAQNMLTSNQTVILALAGMLLFTAMAAYVALWPRIHRPAQESGPFKAKPLLTANELEFYNRLVSALPGYIILSQVSMSALLEPRTSDPAEYMRRRARFAQKFVDFVVCHPGDLQVVCIIELDDVTHDEKKDAARDEMTRAAGYVTVRWHSRKKPDRREIARRIRAVDESRNDAGSSWAQRLLR